MVGTTSGAGTPGGMNEIPLLSDQNAIANALRMGMGIVKNLDTISLVQVGEDAKWKYNTSSSKPTLHPLGHVRINSSQSEGSDDTWKEVLMDLINDLPADVKAAYEQNQLLPPELRNMSLVALGRLLEGAAKALSWLNNSAGALDPQNPAIGEGSAIDARRSINLALANLTLNGVLSESNPIYQSLQNGLANVGQNHPEFNDLLNFINQVGMAYATLINVSRPNIGTEG